MTEQNKPEAQVISVSGLQAPEITFGGPGLVDWDQLVLTPPFQMYIAEVSKSTVTEVDALFYDFVIEQGTTMGEQGLFDSFMQWRDKKGYWKGMDIWGLPIEGENV